MGEILKTIRDTHPLRRALRYKLFKPDAVNIAGDVLRVHILDLSSGGALVYAASPPAIGTRLKLALGARSARVAWAVGKRFGIAFDRPLATDQVKAIIAEHDALIQAASHRITPLAA